MSEKKKTGKKVEAAPHVQVSPEKLEAAKAEGIHGKDTTPYLLSHIKDYTKGVSFASNLQLAYNNARVAAQIAIEYSKL